jgi:hypothetical protein
MRLYHALREAGLRPLLRQGEKAQVLGLAASGVKLEDGVAPELPGLRLPHTELGVQIGNLTRPYVFPHALVDLCRGSWADVRELRASFRGLMTSPRSAVLAGWQGAAGVQITGSRAGRNQATKYWDTGYFQELGNSEHVLCPNGDCPFSYRVFEAALCGGMPIVEEPHPGYKRLDVLVLGETRPESLPAWDPELAHQNFEIARDLVTIPLDELRSEVLRLRGPR